MLEVQDRAGVQWARSRTTVEAVLHAASDLIAEHGAGGLRIAEVSQRSGVGTSSIYHFFGSRSGLIASAITDRFDRTMGDERSVTRRPLSDTFEELRTASSSGCTAAETRPRAHELLRPLSRDVRIAEQRRRRMLALGAAARNAAVLDRLGASLRRHMLGLEGQIASALDAGALAPELSPRAVANYCMAHQMGLVINDLDPDPVIATDWEAVTDAAFDNLLPDRPASWAEFPGPDDLVTLLAPLEADPTAGPIDEEDPEVRVVAVAARAYRRGGLDRVTVAEVRRESGVSAGWFHRHFGGREELLDVVRIDLYRAHVMADAAAMHRIMAWAGTPAQFVGATLLAANAELQGGRHAVRWDMVETFGATEGRPVLLRALGEVEHAGTAAFAAALERGQRNGVIHPDVPLRAAARYLMGYHFGLLFGEVAGLTPTPLEWRTVIQSILWAMTTDGWTGTSP